MKAENENQDPPAALNVLDSLLVESGQKIITKEQVMMILDSLANSDDSSLVNRFVVVLAICVRRGLELNTQALFGRYWETSPKRQNLEKMCLASAHVLKLENIQLPNNFNKMAESLNNIYSEMFSSGNFQLSNGMRLSLEEMQHRLQNYLSGVEKSSGDARQGSGPSSPNQINAFLDRLFSPKQKELVFKKLKDEFVTKTEREYYSRVVKKKLEAIADSGIREIATTLTRK
jgi:hypothetical protein